MTDATLVIDGAELEVSVLRLQPDDIILLSPRNWLTQEQIAFIRDAAAQAFHDNQIRVVQDIDVSVLRPESAA